MGILLYDISFGKYPERIHSLGLLPISSIDVQIQFNFSTELYQVDSLDPNTIRITLQLVRSSISSSSNSSSS